MNVNYLDILLASIILGFAIWGFRKKLLFQMVIFIGLFLALFLSMEGLEIVAPLFASISIVSGSTAILIALIITFLVVYYLYFFFQKWANKNAKMKMPEVLDNAGGVILGLLNAFLVGCFLTLSLMLAPASEKFQDQIYDAKLRPTTETIGTGVYNFFAKMIPGSVTFVQCLEAVTNEIGIQNFDSDYYAILIELNSTKAEEWMSLAKK